METSSSINLRSEASFGSVKTTLKSINKCSWVVVIPTFAGSIGPRTVKTFLAALCFGTGCDGEVKLIIFTVFVRQLKTYGVFD